MNAEEQKRARELWVEALRSGDYAQTDAALQDSFGYCCLGVLCDVAEHNGINVAREPSGYLHGAELNQQTAVMEWAGIQNGEGWFHTPTGRESLAGLNDDEASFQRLADIIESEPEGLFV